MIQVLQIIWRLDHNVSYKYFDNRGEVFRLINSVENFWSQIGPGNAPDSFVALFGDQFESRMLNVDPTSISGSFDWVDEVTPKQATDKASFVALSEMVARINSVTDLNALRRVGIRFLGVCDIDTQFFSERNCKGKVYNEDGMGIFGSVSNYSSIINGITPDKIRYRFNVGRPSREALELSFGDRLRERIDSLIEKQCFFDIDLFEEQSALYGRTLHRMCLTRAKALNELLENFPKILTGASSA